MSQTIRDLDQLLASIHPELNEGVFVFASVPVETDVEALMPVATFREKEGLTLIVGEEMAERAGLDVLFRSAWITLTVHSDLHAVGLTAAFAKVLSEAGISCNVIAAAHHDHLFVPVDSAKNAMAQLIHLQKRAQDGT
jgi:hypothetical protein